MLEENLKKGGAVPTLPLFSEIDALLASRPGIRDLILQRAAVVVRSRMQASKRQAHQLSFDDLLKDLDGALDSPLGERLCERIRATYRVAMIVNSRIPTPSSTVSSTGFTAATRTRRC